MSITGPQKKRIFIQQNSNVGSFKTVNTISRQVGFFKKNPIERTAAAATATAGAAADDDDVSQ